MLQITQETPLMNLTVGQLQEILKGFQVEDKELNKAEVMENLRIGKTKYQEILKRRSFPLPMKGTPKKKFIKLSDLNEWKSKHWGKY